MYEDPTGHISWKKVGNFVKKAAKVVAIVAVTAVVVTAVVASAAIYYGAGTAAEGLATAATVGTYAVAGGVAIAGANRATESVTGKNYVADTVFKGNVQAYNKAEALVNIAAYGAISVGSTYGSNTQSKSKEKNVTNAKSNTKSNPIKAQSSVYKDATGRYLVEGHHTTVANTMLGKGSGINMNIPTQQMPSSLNVYWTKKWYEFGKTAIKITD